ncbi:MAG: short-chain dehydrogenase, partial [Candidatus Komeilibacteria bacterium]|nr:short-chain dehydrogenase [Candidatus Komeilibacteria bacterium]
MKEKTDDVPFTALILGGGGLVGRQVALLLANLPQVERLVICALTVDEVERAKAFLLPQLPDRITVEWESGNLFVPTQLAHVSPAKLKESPEFRSVVLRSIYAEPEEVWRENHLAQLILKWRPTWIVDGVNTATGISYANSWDITAKVLQDLKAGVDFTAQPADLETLLMSSGIPQLTQHVAILQRATREVGTQMYLKVGTTGTGGMGLNIPYTHGEGKPSRVLMGKNAISGAQMFLLLLSARTPSPSCMVTKALVPAAMIGYSGIRYGRPLPYKGREFELYDPRAVSLSRLSSLEVVAAKDAFEMVGNIEIVMIGTGENGEFTLEEFRAITAPGQMEMVTAEEVARMVVSELIGRNTGHDLIAAMDAGVISPSNHGGLLRERALAAAEIMAAKEGDFSVALGELGPPQLTKLLYEFTFILKACEIRG